MLLVVEKNDIILPFEYIGRENASEDDMGNKNLTLISSSSRIGHQKII